MGSRAAPEGAATLAAGALVEVAIERIATGGDGVGRLADGRVVFVPFVAPGERVAVEVVESEPRFARGIARDIVAPSPARVEPRCPLFGRCGGCTLQHLAAEAQLEAKQRIVRDHLVRPGHVAAEQVRAIRASPRAFGYRHRMRFHAQRGRLGLFRHASGELIETAACPIAAPGIDALLPDLARLVAAGTPARLEIEIVEEQGGGVLLAIGAVAPPGADLEPLAQALLALPVVRLVTTTSSAGRRVLSRDAGAAPAAPPGTFRQANPAANEILRELVADAAGAGTDTVLELFAGSGNLSFPIAARGHPVIAVENDPHAVEAGTWLARERGAPVELVRASVASFVHGARAPRVHTVVANPPRTGLPAKTAPALAHLGAKRLVYVSCDPATLGRDLGRLRESGFAPQSVQPVDLFPQTAHVECVVVLER